MSRLEEKLERIRNLRERAEQLEASGRASDRRRALKLWKRVRALALEVMSDCETLNPALAFLPLRKPPLS